MTRYVIDTYSLIDWFAEDNGEYEKYFAKIRPKESYITSLTLMEFYHRVYHVNGESVANEFFEYLKNQFNVIELNEYLIKESGIFRSQMLKKKKELSYSDCVNYVVAKALNVKLLTGDDDFKDMDNVEFVK